MEDIMCFWAPAVDVGVSIEFLKFFFGTHF